MAMELPIIENRSILTSTGGFLGDGFTHTINAYSGCSFADSLCASFCYAQHNYCITKGRKWKLYGVKGAAVEAYKRDYDRIKSPRRGSAGAIRILMSSSTDPYVPKEQTWNVTRGLLQAMCERAPDAIVIQTRSPLVRRDTELICRIAGTSRVRTSREGFNTI